MQTDRAAAFAQLEKERFDLLVIGGGITGTGVARDAALRGLKVALVEKTDFGSGTSSKSSKLVHGGLRYLEHAQFRLVFEGTNERAACGSMTHSPSSRRRGCIARCARGACTSSSPASSATSSKAAFCITTA
jgi:glycerol-3-phosphate dehydrogenase